MKLLKPIIAVFLFFVSSILCLSRKLFRINAIHWGIKKSTNGTPARSWQSVG